MTLIPRLTRTRDRRHRLSAPLRMRNYRAAWSIVRVFPHPFDMLRRYVTTKGDYPWETTLRTPTGLLRLQLPHPHDVRTLNEVFARHDYGTGAPRVVVDIGGNIGISAAYFLTRRPDSRVHLWEPVPHNLDILRRNLAPFADRVVIHERALAPVAGPARFVIEPVGRYSGLSQYHTRGGQEVVVECDEIGPALDEVLAREGAIDLVKIDTEGSEQALIDAIGPDRLSRLGAIVHEVPDGIRWLGTPPRN